MVFSEIYEETNATIHIHNDYCCNVKASDISHILSQIGVLISNSYHHAEPAVADGLEVSKEKL